MDYNLNIDELSLRMLGYYNTEGQNLTEESEEVEFADKLAERLKVTFANIKDMHENQDFKDAVDNGVFILRDKPYNLYAFWPKKGIARVTNVVYSKDKIKQLQSEYKEWFIPGEALTITKTKKFLLDYLDFEIGKKVILKTDYWQNELFGQLEYVGKDFLSIKDNKSNTYHIGKHFCIKVLDNSSFNNMPTDTDFGFSDDNDKKLIPMGTITNYDKYGFVWIMTAEGKSIKFSKEEFLVEPPQQGSKIVYSLKNNKIKSVHLASTISECLFLAKELHDNKNKSNAARDVIQHILNNFPYNVDAKALKNEIDTAKEAVQEITTKFKQAEELILTSPQDSIESFTKLLNQGKRTRDCINKIMECYKILFDKSVEEEEKNVQRNEIYKFIQKNHTKLSTSQSQAIRLNYFFKMGMSQEYLETIDQVLQDPQTDIKKRAKMLYFKAEYYKSRHIEPGNEENSEHLIYAKESVYLSPFNNKTELMFKEYNIDYEPTSCPSFENIPLDIINLIEYTNVKEQDLIEYLPIYDKEDSTYLKKILVNAKLKDPVAVVEYIAALALNLSKKEEDKNSALYLWNRLFGIIDKFGYFLQHNLALALSRILNISIDEDETLVSAPIWENKKNWKKIIDDAKVISKEQLEQIYYIIKNNESIVEKVENYINENNIKLKDSKGNSERIELRKLFHSEKSEIEKAASEHLNKSYENRNSLSDIYQGFTRLNCESYPFNKLRKSDSILLHNFYDKCIKDLETLISENKQNKKIQHAKRISETLQSIISGITSSPTPFGVEGILSCIINIQKHLNIVKDLTLKPEISIKINERNLKKDDDGFYVISATASNLEGTLDAYNLCFILSPKCNKVTFGTPPIKTSILKEGTDMSLIFKFKPNPNDIHKSSFKFGIQCFYSANGNKERAIFEDLQVYLSDDQFVKIDYNPYNKTTINHKDITFVGREKEIDEITRKVLDRETAQIIVYGQKRCGKTTLVNAVANILKEESSSQTFCVYWSYKSGSESDFYWSILKEIDEKLDDYVAEGIPEFNLPSQEDFYRGSSFDIFSNCIKDFKISMQKTKGWENRKLIFILDEFTTLFADINEEKVSKDILTKWKNIQENEKTCFPTIFVGHDIVPVLFDKPYARNAATIFEKYPLTYLDEKAARELIERPIEIKGNSRFDEDAINKIIYYTSRSPYFLQIFMDKMVGYINENSIVKVTDVDVVEVAKNLLDKEKDVFTNIGTFDHLINPGLPEELCEIKESDIENVLRQIALSCRDTEWCNVTTIYEKLLSLDTIDKVLDDLDNRKVIDRKQNGSLLRIKVGLFKEWFINN